MYVANMVRVNLLRYDRDLSFDRLYLTCLVNLFSLHLAVVCRFIVVRVFSVVCL